MTWSEHSRSVTVPLVAFLVLLSSLVLVSPARSVDTDPPIDGTVLVVAPHPDDDVITAAGITYNRPNTVIAYMTNGDSHSRSEDGTVATVTNPSTFTYTGADLSDLDNNPPLGIAITLTGVPIPVQRTIAAIDKVLKKITLNAPVTGLAVGATFETDAFAPIGIAETRQAEAVSAQRDFLGRVENDLRFLGYPDFWLEAVWNTYAPAVQPGEGANHYETFASRGLGRTDWHDYRMGPGDQHAPYNREAMLADMIALIDDVRPDHVFTTSPEDGTADHRTTYAVVKAAMEQVHDDDPSYLALLHSTVVWQSPFSTCLNDYWPLDYPKGSGLEPLPFSDPNADRSKCGFADQFAPNWDAREIFNVPPALMNSNTGANPKYQAIEAHASQGGMAYGSYIARFFHSDEFFWVEAIPGTPVAVDDGPFTVDWGQQVSVNGVLDNDTGVNLTSAVLNDPAHGTVALNPDGTFTYTHDGSATTSDSFTYRARDAVGTESSPATVTIAVNGGPPTTTTTTPPSGADVHSVGLVDPGSGKWHLYNEDGLLEKSFFYGNPGDYPIYGDWNGDGVETPGLYRQSDGYVYLRNSNTQGIADIKFFFGNPGDVPIAGDFNNDGFDTVSIYRPSNQTFYIINKLGSGDQGLGAADFSYVFGNPGDKPFVGDFNGNGVETVGLHRESTGLVYFRNTHTQGNADAQFIFGDPGDRLVAGDWTADGTFTPALFRPSNTTMYFRYTNTQGNADNQWIGGQATWLPVSGNNGLG